MHQQSTIVQCAGCGINFAARPRSARYAEQRWFCGQPCYYATRRLPKRSIEDRFWAKVDKDGPIPPHRPDLGACWLWTGARQYSGYGKFSLAGRLRGAHVAAYILTVGHEPPAEAPWVLHRCDGGAIGCVRPSHLFVGDAKANTADMIAKGRRVVGIPPAGDAHPFRKNPALAARGERSAAAKITAEVVVMIRERYAAGDIRQSDLAREYGLAQSALGAIVTGRSWAHIGGPLTRTGKGGNQHRSSS